MARKKTETVEKVVETLVRLDVRIAELVKDVAQLRKTTISKYLSELLEPIVQKDLDVELRKRLKGK